MSVPEISLVTVLLTSVVPAIGAAQTRGAVATGRSARSSAPANRFVAGHLTGTTVRPAPAPARPIDRFRRPAPDYYRTRFFGFSRADLASYERTLARQYAVTAAAARLDEELGSPDTRPAGYYDAVYPWAPPARAPVEEAVAHLDWKPGGIFPAGEEPAALEKRAASPRPPMPGVFEARVPAAGHESSRLVDVTPVIVWTEVRCLEPDQGKQVQRRLPRVLGWLYRWARGFDIEKTGTTPPLLYLRSPLLSGFQEPTGCSQAARDRADAIANSCYVVTVSNGFDHVATYTISLPQLGSRTARELTAAMRQRLDQGEEVGLKIIGGGVVTLSPEDAASLDVRACETKTD